jgi:hypothetical protein
MTFLALLEFDFRCASRSCPRPMAWPREQGNVILEYSVQRMPHFGQIVAFG